VIRPWIDPVPASKIHITSGAEQWTPLLCDLLGTENLTSTYGGKHQPLCATHHPYASVVKRDGSGLGGGNSQSGSVGLTEGEIDGGEEKDTFFDIELDERNNIMILTTAHSQYSNDS
jgi:hypothetical protein